MSVYIRSLLREVLTAAIVCFMFLPALAMFGAGFGYGPMVTNAGIRHIYDASCSLPVIGGLIDSVGYHHLLGFVGACKLLAMLAMTGTFGNSLDQLANGMFLTIPICTIYVHRQMGESTNHPRYLLFALALRLFATSPEVVLRGVVDPSRNRAYNKYKTK
jgi:hypothetical protein